MKFAVFSLFFVIVVVSGFPSFIDNDISGSGEDFALIPDGFGVVKFANVYEELEASPLFNIQQDTRFLLFTRQNPLVAQVLRFDDLSTVTASNWSSSRPTRILVHGWQSTENVPLNILSTAAYLSHSDVNVIVVDWSIGAQNINYITSRNLVGPVGSHVAVFLDNLHAANLLTNLDSVYCVGQSLGAHVCGFVGKRVTRGRLNTIVGLDPAGPLFDANNPLTRLDASDASYVEIIHTDTVLLGITFPIGHADFYPNGGSGMPGCSTAACDHAIAANYFADSINSPLLWGRRCETLDQMNADQCTGEGFSMGGEPSNYRINLRGIFRMPTNAEVPFGIGPF